MACKKRGYHFTTECENSYRDGIYKDTDRKPKKLRSRLLNTRKRDAPAAQRALMNRNSVVSPFLRLPGEIRNKIYGFIVGDHHLQVGYTPHQHGIETIKGKRYRTHVGGGFFNRLAARGKNHHRYQEAQSLHLGLLRVCRQVYGEAALLPYAMNIFSFENDWVMRRCLKTLRPAQKRAMGKLFVQ